MHAKRAGDNCASTLVTSECLQKLGGPSVNWGNTGPSCSDVSERIYQIEVEICSHQLVHMSQSNVNFYEEAQTRRLVFFIQLFLY